VLLCTAPNYILFCKSQLCVPGFFEATEIPSIHRTVVLKALLWGSPDLRNSCLDSGTLLWWVCMYNILNAGKFLLEIHYFFRTLYDSLKQGRIYAVMGTILNNFIPSKTFVSMIQAAILHPNYDRFNEKEHHDDIAVLKVSDFNARRYVLRRLCEVFCTI